MTLTPTPEQQAAIDLFRQGGSLAIEAGAGTGKTSVLQLIAEATQRRGQYCAFNKSIVVEAGQRMPGNIVCSTAHSLAFRAVGHRYAHRLRGARMRSSDIARLLGVDPFIITYGSQRKVLQPGYLGGLVMRGVGNFCRSTDAEPSEAHVPYVDGIDVPDESGRRTWTNNRELRRHVLPAVRRAWADLQRTDGQVRFSHDVYLKLWALSQPRMSADFILFDEAQDADPVVASVMEAQTHAQLIVVGDSAQEIYGWRNAVNALANFDVDHRTFLSYSFRFGPAVAEVANRILAMINGIELRLVGSDRIASVVAPVPDPDAILCRTNAMAVETVLHHQREGRRVHLVGGGAEVLSFARGVDDLRRTGWTSHPELACFDSWGEVVDYADNDELGGELRLLVNLVEEFGTAAIVRALGRMPSEANAETVVSTAHKAKGREWNSVKLAGDFPDPKEREVGDEELRLLYVACTRAQRELDISAVGLLAKPTQPEIPVLAEGATT